MLVFRHTSMAPTVSIDFLESPLSWDEQQLQTHLSSMAAAIDAHFHGRSPLLVGIESGGAWVATAPIPVLTNGTRDPTAISPVDVATPSAPVFGQRPRIVNVLNSIENPLTTHSFIRLTKMAMVVIAKACSPEISGGLWK